MRRRAKNCLFFSLAVLAVQVKAEQFAFIGRVVTNQLGRCQRTALDQAGKADQLTKFAFQV
ncbi:hypothetical protein SDC9_133957 [bioreactor metagenome]|uniref:Uncharacterized protein n=1 Tax=bioreactor metagenome TaxID=1076179 RepID=A0A645DCE3_9ZZZZ